MKRIYIVSFMEGGRRREVEVAARGSWEACQLVAPVPAEATATLAAEGLVEIVVEDPAVVEEYLESERATRRTP